MRLRLSPKVASMWYQKHLQLLEAAEFNANTGVRNANLEFSSEKFTHSCEPRIAENRYLKTE